MDEGPRARLSGITTMWTVFEQAQGCGSDADAARGLLLHRYGAAARRYLVGALRDGQAADDLLQEFAVVVLSGRLANADPGRGRLRDYIRGVLSNLVNAHRRRSHRGPLPLPPEAPALAGAAAPQDDPDRAWRETWAAELLANTWAALAGAQPGLHRALRCRADLPDHGYEQLAAELGRRSGRETTPEAARQAIHRARVLFAELLLHEVAQSLARPTPEAVEEELRDLDLLTYCRPALERRSGGAG